MRSMLAFPGRQSRSGGFAPEQVVLFLTATTGAAEAAENKDGNARSNEYREQRSKRE